MSAPSRAAAAKGGLPPRRWLVADVVVGLLAVAVGGATLAAGGMPFREGPARTRLAENACLAGTGPFPADVRDEGGYGHAGFGIEPPARWRDASRSGTHPGVGEF